MKTRFLALLMIGLLPAAAAAQAPCSAIEFDKIGYTVCTADPKRDDIRLFWKGADNQPYGGFTRLAADLATRNLELRFAMNAGMYERDRSPVGLYIESGREMHKANLRKGPGNFHMRPNGVFYIGKDGVGIMETQKFADSKIKPRHASQSGPMLVIGGKLHPRFLPDGTSAKLRNGVGVDRQGVAHFAISEAPVTFHEFARLFRDRLNCPDALFFDGSVSSLYAPNLGRTGNPLVPIGPIVGVVTSKTP